jgi:galactokinase
MNLRDDFAAHFALSPDLVVRAPGRVNLIGEHTDYNDGFVLPAAIGRETQVAARRREGATVRVVACDLDNAEDVIALDAPILPHDTPGWADYVRGMLAVMQMAGVPLTGADIMIRGDIPQGSGLSSSASLSVAVGTAMAVMAGASNLDMVQIALLAQQSECDFVGTKCGIMDQLISATGVAGHALLIDCRSLERYPVAMPADAAILIVHSGITRGLVDGHYNERRAQCESVAAALNVPALRDLTMEELLVAEAMLDPVAFRRARHVISENARTLDAAQALKAGDLAAMGVLMAASHISMRDDFQITLPQIDALVALLQDVTGNRGGARMTGGGFGGAVVALCPNDAVDDVVAAVRAGYQTPDGTPPDIMVERASAGVSIL